MKIIVAIIVTLFCIQCGLVQSPGRNAKRIGILKDISVFNKKESFMRSTTVYAITLQNGKKIFAENVLKPLVTGDTLWCNNGIYFQVFR